MDQRSAPRHRVWPYPLKDLRIERPNPVRCADITYTPVRRGFLYLAAIMDWASRHVLAWRLSNTLDAGFCTDAPEEALARYGAPEIFNADQGSPFISFAFTARPQAAGIRISMAGRGRCMDNVFSERLWRSLKYEAVHLHEIADGLPPGAPSASGSASTTPRGPTRHRAGGRRPRPTGTARPWT